MKQLDPASGQPVASAAGSEDPTTPPVDPGTASAVFDRRRGQRRGDVPEPETPEERRKADRRRRKPGLPALLGAILGVDEEEPTPEEQH